MRPAAVLAAMFLFSSSATSHAAEDKPAKAVRKLLKKKKVPDVAALEMNSGPTELMDAGTTAPFWFLVAQAPGGKSDEQAGYYAAYDSKRRKAYYKNKWAFALFVQAAGIPKEPKKLSGKQLASAWWVLTLGTAPRWKGEPKLTTEADGTLVVTATSGPPRGRVLEIRISPKGKVSAKSRGE